MEIQKLLFFSFFFFLVSLVSGNQYGLGGSSNDHLLLRPSVVDGFRPKKLFVIGDASVDTGNRNKSYISWKEPYGITFPGKPGGRVSDGHVLSEYLAKYLGLKSPIPYEQRNNVSAKRWQYGMNFASAASGVFKTNDPVPTIRRQIDFLQNLIDDGNYDTSDLSSSWALVTVSGNDYINAMINHASDWDTDDFIDFIFKEAEQLRKDLKRIHKMGMKKILVTLMQPLGCLPVYVTNDYTQCNETINCIAQLHNYLLKKNLKKLNNENDPFSFVGLDLYAAFTSVINNKGDPQGSVKFETPLRGCCEGINISYFCADVVNGEKMYTLCDDPRAALFWDGAHPSQAGWRELFTFLIPSIPLQIN